MNNLTLIIPAAGRGSRFSKNGIITPKPLIDLNGKPFFWWATESIKQHIPLQVLIFVILEEHIASHNIDQEILSYYPQAKLVVIPDVTKGAAETALLGIQAMEQDGPIAINDCDHAFKLANPQSIIDYLPGLVEGGLITFESNNPGYSYVKFDPQQNVIGTVEKQVVSNRAIAGCYFFNNKKTYLDAYQTYIDNCAYDEYFISGLYNVLANDHKKITIFELAHHCAFGTPPEFEAAKETIKSYADWTQ